MTEGNITLDHDLDDGILRLRPGGCWDSHLVGAVDSALRALPRAGCVRIDGGGLTRLDTAGAWLLHRTAARAERDGSAVIWHDFAPRHRQLLDTLADLPASGEPEEAPPPPLLLYLTAEIGAATLAALRRGRDLLGFLGALVVAAGQVVRRPADMRLTALVAHLERTGVNAIPIVALITFLIGVVLAYQGISQLERFGAQVYMVNLVTISVLREIGVLLTAVVLAGRSGSAFAAQIGTMKVNQEIDAMRTMGLDPMVELVLPRVLALVIALPLLTFLADIMGLMGGALMAVTVLDMTISQYAEAVRQSIKGWTLWVGLIKAPVFAFVIAMVGCHEGLRASASAESVGRQTTRSVVEAIFLVIILDAGFSIAFNMVGV